MKMELNKTKTLILLFIFITIGGIILYGENNPNNFSPLDYIIK